MVRVYLVQHAKAYSKDEDETRPLTPEGEMELSRVCEFLKRVDLEISEIYHSPKLRANQTANILCEYLASDVSKHESDDLLPMADPSLIGDQIKTNENNHIYIGHLPHMERLASYLTTGNKDGKVIDFEKGGVVCLERSDGAWYVKWIVTPELLAHDVMDDGMFA